MTVVFIVLSDGGRKQITAVTVTSNRTEAELKRNLGARRGSRSSGGGCGGTGFGVGCGGTSFGGQGVSLGTLGLPITLDPFSNGGKESGSLLGQLRIQGAEASNLRAQAHVIRKNGFLQAPSGYSMPEPEVITEMVPEVIQPSPIVIPIAFSAPAPAPAAQIEPIVIETFVEPSAQRQDTSSLGQQLLLQRISERLEERLNQPTGFQQQQILPQQIIPNVVTQQVMPQLIQPSVLIPQVVQHQVLPQSLLPGNNVYTFAQGGEYVAAPQAAYAAAPQAAYAAAPQAAYAAAPQAAYAAAPALSNYGSVPLPVLAQFSPGKSY